MTLRNGIVLFLAVSVQVISSGTEYTYGVFSLSFMAEFNVSESTVNYPATAMYTLTAAVGLVAVPVVELVGWQLSSAIGITITIIGLVSAYFVTSFSYLFASFGICTGIGFGLTDFISFLAVQVYYDHNIAFGNGVMACGYEIGPALFGPVIAYILNRYGWRVSVLFLAGICVSMYCSCFFFKLPPSMAKCVAKQYDNNSEKTKSHKQCNDMEQSKSTTYETFDTTNKSCDDTPYSEKDKEGRHKRTNSTISNYQLWTRPLFILVLFSYVLFIIHYQAVFIYITRKSKSVGISDQKGAWLLTTIGFSSFILRIAAVTIISMELTTLLYTGGIAGCLASISCLLIPAMETFPLLIVCSVIWGICLGHAWPCYYSLANRMDASPTKIYAIAGMFLAAAVGSIILPLTGFIVESWGSVDIAFIYGGTAGLISGVTFIVGTYLLTRYENNEH